MNLTMIGIYIGLILSGGIMTFWFGYRCGQVSMEEKEPLPVAKARKRIDERNPLNAEVIE